MIIDRSSRCDSFDPTIERAMLDQSERKALDSEGKPMGLLLNRRPRPIFALLAPLATFAGMITAPALAVMGCGGNDTIDDDAGTTVDVVEEAPEMDRVGPPDAGRDISVTPDADGGGPGVPDVSRDADASAPPDVRVDLPPDVRIDVQADVQVDALVDVQVDALIDVRVDVPLDARVDVPLDATDVNPDGDVSTDVNVDVLPDAPLDAPDASEMSDVRDVNFGDASPTAPPLGAAATFAVLGGSAVSSTGLTVVNGNLGVWPGSAISGFGPGVVIGGTIDPGGQPSADAQGALTPLYNTLAGMPCNTDMTSIDLSGKTLGPGVYCFSSSAAITTTGTLTLDAGGNPNAAWVFQIGSTLTTSDGSAVNVINGGSACNVFWQIGSSATIGSTNAFGGNIVAFADITVRTGSSVSGRLLARTGAVTLDANAVAFATCGSGPGADAALDVADGDSSSDADSSSDVLDADDAPDGG